MSRDFDNTYKLQALQIKVIFLKQVQVLEMLFNTCSFLEESSAKVIINVNIDIKNP